ncbi:Glucosamine 6-phosphate N-acetyltransferase [Plasmodiophora brassicae]|uniref:Glucosamine 6-phosphate N-acetyltransferase n=1 Tax=Plasmodiophora brassicae TaxID=37360 RepID=A0A0G4ILX9_PLABS|nr:hypothetical protein PBRA_004790 [Plasmodiophora brassicae]SPQ93356.1 unnamed protein product [Plasmodiophora brassicae]
MTATQGRVDQLLCHATAARHEGGGATAKLPKPRDNLIIRELQADDYHRGFIKLLGQLTTAGDITEQQFLERFNELKKMPHTYKIAVIIDPAMNLVIASATLLIEKKFVHGCGKVGHVEDVVVNSTYRGRNLGLRVVDQLKTWAGEAGCYKIILDCAAHNVPFYNKLGFVKKEEQMAFYY